MRYMGIDPGKSGGIAVVDPAKRLVYATKMPDTLRGLLNVIKRHAEGTVCYLEQVHSMPRDGGKASFTFGRGFGHIELALTVYDVQYALVLPQTWQRALHTLTGGDKNITKAKAQRMFPRLNVTHATADALLIATYCRHVHEASTHGEEDRKEEEPPPDPNAPPPVDPKIQTTQMQLAADGQKFQAETQNDAMKSQAQREFDAQEKMKDRQLQIILKKMDHMQQQAEKEAQQSLGMEEAAPEDSQEQNGMAQMAQAIAMLSQALLAPKQIIKDDAGRPIGVAPMLEQPQ